MANYMLATGPLSVCVAAEVWNTYRSGIMTQCPGGVDHCVQAVGVDTSRGGYWKVSSRSNNNSNSYSNSIVANTLHVALIHYTWH
jgi:hypothetical protein